MTDTDERARVGDAPDELTADIDRWRMMLDSFEQFHPREAGGTFFAELRRMHATLRALAAGSSVEPPKPADDDEPRALPMHSLTEYGTTSCPVMGVRAFVDDGECSACGGRVDG